MFLTTVKPPDSRRFLRAVNLPLEIVYVEYTSSKAITQLPEAELGELAVLARALTLIRQALHILVLGGAVM
ncbi:MAG: hypothetical protein DRJ43_04415, partial [Thermoprotei archaeon]